MGSGATYDVFLSYARSDGAGAEELNRWLRSQGLRTFFDRSELRPGLRWIPALEDAMGRSKAVAILVGRHGFGNTQQYERELALVRQTRDDGFSVIPVLMPGCKNPPTGFLQLLTWVDLSQGDSVLQQTESLETLRGAIHGQAVSASSIRSLVCPYEASSRSGKKTQHSSAAVMTRSANSSPKCRSTRSWPSSALQAAESRRLYSPACFRRCVNSGKQRCGTSSRSDRAIRPCALWPDAFGAAPEDAGPAAIESYLEGEVAAYRSGDAEKLLSRIVNDRLNAAPEKPDRLLIYVDQWEELYAMAPRPEDQDRRQKHAKDVEKFIVLLVAAATTERSRASVVLTARADFYASLIKDPLLSVLLPRQQVNIPPMSEERYPFRD